MQYFWALVLILIILEYIYIGLYNVVYKGVSDCLNPYYTGIHLHEFGDIVFSVTQRCLNPYYTGIHLHKIPQNVDEAIIIVLILIILEYIYILAQRPFDVPCIYVLILIILEYIYI